MVEPASDEVAQVEMGEDHVRFAVDVTAFPLTVVYGAAYVFLDRCFVFLDKPDAAHVRVTLKPKTAGLPLAPLVDELSEELVSNAWRAQIAKDTRDLIAAATARAHGGGDPRGDAAPSLDDLSSFDFANDAMADPLGLAMSWEDKHGKPAAPAEAPGASGPGAATMTDEKEP